MLRDHRLAPERVDASFTEGGRYGRMFELPALEVIGALLQRVGAAGGFCCAGACEAQSRVETGWPFLGQHVAHDLTADRSPLRVHADFDALRNMSTPRANLESLYRGGPLRSPYMYATVDAAESELFGESRRSLTWHHQWATVNDFLPGLVGIISRDHESCLAVDLDWNPTLPAHGDGFRVWDILVLAQRR